MNSNIIDKKIIRVAQSMSSHLSLNPAATLMLRYIQAIKKVTFSLDNKNDTSSGQVGIWKLDSTGEFKRNHAYSAEFSKWADVERIIVKPNKKNIVLIGESVARGYFFDPVMPFSKILQTHFDYAWPNEVNLIDLARVDLTVTHLIKLLRDARQLKPDSIIVFAGNNWHTSEFMDAGDHIHLAQIYKNNLFIGVRQIVEKYHLQSITEKVCQEISNIINNDNIPIIYILPEFNLTDWQDEHIYDEVLLNPNHFDEWQALCHKHINHEIDSKNLKDILKKIKKNSFGISPLQYHIKAAASKSKKRYYLEKARDSVIGLAIPHSPRIFSVIQNEIRSFAKNKSNFHLVDLPRLLFKNDELPGRNYFIDYCHLNLHGMNEAAFYTVKTTLLAFGHSKAEYSLSINKLFENDAKMETVKQDAHFLAAIHNAHFGQKKEIINYHCKFIENNISYYKKLYSALATSSLPNWLAIPKELHNISHIIKIYLLGKEDKMSIRLNDDVLLNNLGKNIASDDLSFINKPKYSNSLKTKHISLLESRYHAKSFAEHTNFSLVPSIFYRSIRRNSIFQFYNFLNEDLYICVCFKTVSPHNENIELYVNDSHLMSIPPSQDWKKIEAIVPAFMQKQNKNFLNIQWPRISMDKKKYNANIHNKFEWGFVDSIFPTFGEIQLFDMSIYPPIYISELP